MEVSTLNCEYPEIALHRDNDTAGRLAAKTIKTLLSLSHTVSDEPQKRGKDMNDYLEISLGIRQPQEQERLQPISVDFIA